MMNILELSRRAIFLSLTRYVIFEVILSIISFYPLPLSADNCGACYEQQGPGCNATCSKAADEKIRTRCHKTCLIQRCGKFCGYEEALSKDSVAVANKRKGSAARPDRQTSNYTDCDYCHRNAKKSCQSECSSKGPSCEKICISRKCSSKCVSIVPPSEMAPSRSTADDTLMGGSSPNNTSHESYSGASNKRNKCTDCQAAREQICKGQCGAGVGSIACAVACVERACHQDCLID